VDELVVETFDFPVAPSKGDAIDLKSLELSGVAVEEIKGYPLNYPSLIGEIENLLSKHVNPFDPADKFILVGYFNQGFGNEFLRKVFERTNKNNFNAFFFTGTIDVSCLAAEYLAKRRSRMKNFRLPTVAKTLGIRVDEARLNEPFYDIHLIRSIYKIVTKRMEEI